MSGTPPQDSGGAPIPWKIILPVSAGVLILCAGAIAALIIMSRNGGTSIEATTTGTSSTAATSTTATTATAGSTTATTRSTTTGAAATATAFITAMDALVAENTQLEEQGVVYATEINNGGAAAITDTILANIRSLSLQFEAANERAQALATPPAFEQVKADFLQLNAYNRQRSDSLYSASLAWRNGRSTEALFQEGQAAKVAYQALYPVFVQEYAAAKASSQ